MSVEYRPVPNQVYTTIGYMSQRIWYKNANGDNEYFYFDGRSIIRIDSKGLVAETLDNWKHRFTDRIVELGPGYLDITLPINGAKA